MKLFTAAAVLAASATAAAAFDAIPSASEFTSDNQNCIVHLAPNTKITGNAALTIDGQEVFRNYAGTTVQGEICANGAPKDMKPFAEPGVFRLVPVPASAPDAQK